MPCTKFHGDPSQIDLINKGESGLIKTRNILKDLKEIKIIKFDHQDVVRHPLVSKIIKIIKPKLSKNYKTSLNNLMSKQKKTRKTNLIFNYLIKFIAGEDTIRNHLIY